jgi:hypothetical protein
MKQLLSILLFVPVILPGQTISPSQIGVNSQTQFTPAGQPLGAFMSIPPNDTSATIGYLTNAGYTYQLHAPYITTNFTGTAVCQEYVDSSILAIPSLNIGANVPGGQPNSVLYLDVRNNLAANPNFQYVNTAARGGVLVINSNGGVNTSGSYQAIDGMGNQVFIAGEHKGQSMCYLMDAANENYIQLLVTDDGTTNQFSMGAPAGGFTMQVDPNTGGALFSNAVVGQADFEALDAGENITAAMSDGYITTRTPDRRTGIIIQTSSDGNTNSLGIYSPSGTVKLQQSKNGMTWNMSLPFYPDDRTAGASGLITGDLYQDLSGNVHIKL